MTGINLCCPTASAETTLSQTLDMVGVGFPKTGSTAGKQDVNDGAHSIVGMLLAIVDIPYL